MPWGVGYYAEEDLKEKKRRADLAFQELDTLFRTPPDESRVPLWRVEEILGNLGINQTHRALVGMRPAENGEEIPRENLYPFYRVAQSKYNRWGKNPDLQSPAGMETGFTVPTIQALKHTAEQGLFEPVQKSGLPSVLGAFSQTSPQDRPESLFRKAASVVTHPAVMGTAVGMGVRIGAQAFIATSGIASGLAVAVAIAAIAGGATAVAKEGLHRWRTGEKKVNYAKAFLKGGLISGAFGALGFNLAGVEWGEVGDKIKAAYDGLGRASIPYVGNSLDTKFPTFDATSTNHVPVTHAPPLPANTNAPMPQDAPAVGAPKPPTAAAVPSSDPTLPPVAPGATPFHTFHGQVKDLASQVHFKDHAFGKLVKARLESGDPTKVMWAVKEMVHAAKNGLGAARDTGLAEKLIHLAVEQLKETPVHSKAAAGLLQAGMDIAIHPVHGSVKPDLDLACSLAPHAFEAMRGVKGTVSHLAEYCRFLRIKTPGTALV